jgi:hypothetical protein
LNSQNNFLFLLLYRNSNNNRKKGIINKQQHCINSEEFNTKECYEIDENTFNGMVSSWSIIKAIGTCSELKYDSKYFEID